MTNLITEISWQLTNHCTAECSYCPIHFREGLYPDESWDYIKIVNRLVNHYNKNLNRTIRWTFDGGEPLDLYNIVRILSTAKSENNHIVLNTNGGKLWMDWWAIEPVIDSCILTYHYWQNPNLINYIVNIFKEKNKSIIVKVPIRPDYFDADMGRLEVLEKEKQITVIKHLLFEGEFMSGPRYFYTEEQLSRITGAKFRSAEIPRTPTPQVITHRPKAPDPEAVQKYQKDLQRQINENPSYLGKLCNAGIERLYISHLGFVNGSKCRNVTLGNIWQGEWEPPNEPQTCGMMACMDPDDKKITKFT